MSTAAAAGAGVLVVAGSVQLLVDEAAGSSATDVVAAPTPSSRPVTSLWFGDGVTGGCCRSDPSSPGMAEVVADRLGWAQPQVVAAEGTGYVTASTDDGVRTGPYTERIEAAVASTYYDVVVVAGGNEDARGFDAGAFRGAVRAVLSQVRTSLPDAQLVVLGAYSPDGTGMAGPRQVQREEAARVGAIFIDQVQQGWLRGRPDLLHTDRFHPDADGHALLGARAAQALREALPPELTPSVRADDA